MRASKQPFASRTISVLPTFAAVVVFASHIAANVDRQRTRKWENYTKDEKEAELLVRCGIEEAANGQCQSERDTAAPLDAQATLGRFFSLCFSLKCNITVCGIIIYLLLLFRYYYYYYCYCCYCYYCYLLTVRAICVV